MSTLHSTLYLELEVTVEGDVDLSGVENGRATHIVLHLGGRGQKVRTPIAVPLPFRAKAGDTPLLGDLISDIHSDDIREALEGEIDWADASNRASFSREYEG